MPSCPTASRRAFMAGSAVAALALAISGVLLSTPAISATSMSPDAALKRMMDGNRRFVAHQLEAFAQDLAIIRAETEELQEPYAAVLSCADSRVPVEIIFDENIGRLFVARVAGNISTPEVIASLEYGVAVLGVVTIMVLGHGHCGAVKAAIKGDAVPGQISVLYAPIRAAVDQAGPDLEATIKANARIQARMLSEASPVLAGQIRSGKLKVVAAYYDLVSGAVQLLA
jgi:carbonic anhydrase